MPPIYFVAFMIIILPVLIIIEGVGMFSSFMARKGWWWYVPHVLIVILSLLVVVLLLSGYRWNS